MPGNLSHLFMSSSGSRDYISPVHIFPAQRRQGEIMRVCKLHRVRNYQVSPRITLHRSPPKHTYLLNLYILSGAGSYESPFPFTVSFSNGITPGRKMRGTGSRATGLPASGRQAPLQQEAAACLALGRGKSGFLAPVPESDRVRQKPQSTYVFLLQASC